MEELNGFTSSALREAGHQLWEKLSRFETNDIVVVATSRESAAISYYLAEKFHAPWEVLSCKSVTDPANPAKTIGSVSDCEILMHDTASLPDKLISHQIHELQRGILLDNHFFSTVAGQHDLKYKTVILVTERLENFDSVAATLKSVNGQHPLKTIVASLVVCPEAARVIASNTDGIVFLKMEKVI